MDGQIVIPGVYFEEPKRWLKAKNTYISVKHVYGQWKTYKVLRYFPYSYGPVFRFKIKKTQYDCAAWKGFTPEDFGDHWRIFAEEGKTAPLSFHAIESPGEEYQLLLRTHRDADTVRTLKGGLQIPWIPLLIVIAVIVAGYVAYSIFNKSQPTTSPTAVPGPTATISQGK